LGIGAMLVKQKKLAPKGDSRYCSWLIEWLTIRELIVYNSLKKQLLINLTTASSRHHFRDSGWGKPIDKPSQR
jgi:hypothetical protein